MARPKSTAFQKSFGTFKKKSFFIDFSWSFVFAKSRGTSWASFLESGSFYREAAYVVFRKVTESCIRANFLVTSIIRQEIEEKNIFFKWKNVRTFSVFVCPVSLGVSNMHRCVPVVLVQLSNSLMRPEDSRKILSGWFQRRRRKRVEKIIFAHFFGTKIVPLVLDLTRHSLFMSISEFKVVRGSATFAFVTICYLSNFQLSTDLKIAITCSEGSLVVFSPKTFRWTLSRVSTAIKWLSMPVYVYIVTKVSLAS